MLGKVDTGVALAGAGLISWSSVFGTYAPIVVAAVFGGLLVVSESEDKSFRTSGWLLFKSIALAVLFTTSIASIVAWKFDVQAGDIIFPLAGFIAWMADKGKTIRDAIADRIVGRIKE